MASSSERPPQWKRLFDAGADVVGAAAGGTVGLIGGPPGVLLGAATGVAVTRTLRSVGNEIEERVLGPRQHERVAAAYALASVEIQRRIDRGEKPRAGGFFDEDEAGRSDANELLEGLLLHAANEYEARKIPYLANLFAALVFRADVSPAEAQHLLRLADRLTYHQLCMLSMFGNARWTGQVSEIESAQGEAIEGQPRANPRLIAELDELGNASILGYVQQGGGVAHFASVYDGGSFFGAKTTIKPMPAGADLYELMGLERVPEHEINDLLREFAL